MSQPKWKFFAKLGDKNPIDHGGQFIFTDETGVYQPEVEVLNKINENEWEAHRFILEPCTFENDVLSDNEFHKDHPAWFADSLTDVAEFIGAEDAREIIDALIGDNLLHRAEAYLSIAAHHGIINFDEYPKRFTDRELVEKRYANYE